VRKRSGFLGFLLGLGLLGVAGAAVSAWLSRFHHLFDLVAMFAGPALSAAVVGLVLATILRRWRMAGGFVAAALALFVFLQPQWSPRGAAPSPAAPPVTVYFANVWAQNEDNAALARSIAAADADVVALVEITDHHAGAMSEILKGYPYRTSTSPARRFRGGPRVVVGSRYPLGPSDTGLRDGLAVGEVTVSGPSGPFRLMAVHLTRPWPLDGRVRAQRDQTRRLARRIRAGEDERLLVVGDFNATASSAILRRFANEAEVTPAPARTGTWFDPLPGVFRIAIDNAFVGRGLAVTDRRVGRSNGSDHLPIIVTVKPARRTNG